MITEFIKEQNEVVLDSSKSGVRAEKEPGVALFTEVSVIQIGSNLPMYPAVLPSEDTLRKA